ncbi:nitrate reductase [Thalassotalea agarivorans]|uniref:Assimilatory nitrate reductase (NADH) alpha subunit apoprotein n=1 Tax=Thalassotalea agarivorans TaxID=349064 RepID=A0A1I0CUF9_THASX|nr:nitrate reductase [Thalassotalea agarivorans]SET22929.1 assimilatory nitrate reductase (NADH) alpha subunit apoprotein [Thalassotalea agarivorans]
MADKVPLLAQSTCAYCGVGCGVDIQLENGQAKAIKGSEDHPANFGRLCVKGSHLLDTIDLSGRLLTPQIDNTPCDWPTAVDHVADKLARTIEQYGPESVAFYVSGQLLTEDYYVANKLMKGYLGSANIDTNSRLCMSSAVASYTMALGEDVVPCDYQDLEQTDLLIMVGSNAAWTHPVLYQRIERAKQLNPDFKIVVIDPRRTFTSDIADHFLQIKPGSDAAFFNGLLCYLANNDGLDQQFLLRHTDDAEAAITAASEWTIDKVASYCQVPADSLTDIYKTFCQVDKAVTFYSMGINQSSSGVEKCLAIINCHLASGKIGKPGSGPFSITGQPNAMGGREVGGMANQLTAHLSLTDSAHTAAVQSFWQSPTIASKPGAKAVDLFQKMANGEIKFVWIMATNPMVSLPNRALVEQALSRCETVVVSDCNEHTDTMDFATVKLPATSWLEKDGTVTNAQRTISRQRGVHSPAGAAKHDWQIVSDVAQKMGFSGFDYQSPHQVFVEYAQLTGVAQQFNRVLDLSPLASLSTSQYQTMKPVQWPLNGQRPFANGKFSTSNGKAKLFAITPKAPVQQTTQALPFVLNSGRVRDQWHTMTRTGKADKLGLHQTQPEVMMHPFDAEQKGLSQGELVRVSNDLGHVIAPLNVSNTVRVGELFMAIHWNQQFASHANVSQLYQDVVDPISGQPESKHAPVAISAHPFAYYGTIQSKQTLEVQADYFVKSIGQASFQTNIAFETAPQDIFAWCKESTQLTGEWLSQSSENGTYIVCLQNQQLVFIGYFANAPIALHRDWINSLFAQNLLSLENLHLLLHGQISEEFNLGRQVCSCFNVREKTIIEAVKTGCNSVDKLGEKLKCGTNCGSCKAELGGIIKEHAPTFVIKDITSPETA